MVNIGTIFYVIYMIYVISLLVDWEIVVNGDYAIWGLTFLLLAAFTLVFAISVLYISGVDSLGGVSINKYYLIISLGILVFFSIGVIIYQYYTANQNKTSIQNKIIRRPFIPINYQYGTDSQEIGMRLRITDSEIIPRGEALTLQEIWTQLMARGTKETEIREIMRQILGIEMKDSIDILYDLLWYLCVSESPFRIGLTSRETAYAVTADVPELKELLGPNYIGADDKASLIFAVLSGQIIPDTDRIRYDEVKRYPPNIVYNLAFIHNRIIDHELGMYSTYGPYTFLAIRPASPIEDIITNVDIECRASSDNYNTLIERLEIGPVNNIKNMTEDEKIVHLQGELSLYHGVFNRIPGTQPPTAIKGMSRGDILEALSEYTNVELIQAYEPRGTWNSRSELMDLICSDVLGAPRWSIHSTLYCNNDDTLNIRTIDRHGDSEKHDPNDPTLSYGVHQDYRCYQAGELEDCFMDYDGIFLFRVPDWTFGAPFNREFSIDSIKQLRTILERERDNYNVSGLLNKIDTGLTLMNSASMKIRHLKQQFNEFSFEQKHTVKLYLAWMFNYAMWMRFWKGPGSPWPMRKVNVAREADRTRAQRASPEERDEHIFIQGGVRTAIIEMYENDPKLREWIDSLITIYYDFETQEATCASYTIKSIIDRIAVGDYCMGFGSDTILKTSYYYIANLLEHTGASFDEFIERMLPQLQDLEYNSVTSQISTINTPGARLQLLNSRLYILHQPIPKQPSFNPDIYQNNVHIE